MAHSFYERGNITVDENFARFGSKSFAIDKVNSVEVRRQKVGNPWAVVATVIALVCLLIVLPDPGGSPVALILLLVFGFAAFYGYKNPPKDKIHLYRITSSSEAQAFESTNGDEVLDLRDAIENAMVAKTQRTGV